MSAANAETLVSHCALNQITYLLSHKRRELRLHIYYNTEQKIEHCQELLGLRKALFRHFEEHKTVERRAQKYQLMSDDLGMQALLALMLRLSDDEIKGVKTAVEAANRAQSL
jgi:hypothetical protein